MGIAQLHTSAVYCPQAEEFVESHMHRSAGVEAPMLFRVQQKAVVTP
jgi:hypothetical protein